MRLGEGDRPSLLARAALCTGKSLWTKRGRAKAIEKVGSLPSISLSPELTENEEVVAIGVVCGWCATLAGRQEHFLDCRLVVSATPTGLRILVCACCVLTSNP